MSKMAAVDVAVRLQIAGDGKTIGLTDAMSLAGTGYADEDALERFLLGVANRLQLDTPSWRFEWSSIDAARILNKTLLFVLMLIAEKTKPVEADDG